MQWSHIGSANTDDELTVLWKEVEVVREQQCVQPSLFAKIEEKPILHAEHLVLQSVTHKFALNFFKETVPKSVD